MSNDGTRLLQIAALVIPVVVAAAGGKWAVDATRAKVGASSSLPTAAELDSLRTYVVRTPPIAAEPQLPASALSVGGVDPFAKVSRSETRVMSVSTGALTGPIGPRWVVSTIMITENRRVAVINGVMATPGSLLPGGARVLAIEPDHVVLAEASGARREISVQGGAN